MECDEITCSVIMIRDLHMKIEDVVAENDRNKWTPKGTPQMPVGHIRSVQTHHVSYDFNDEERHQNRS